MEMTFQTVEAGQIKTVQEVETMYERKCKILQDKYYNL